MTLYNALTVQSGVTRQVHNTDTLGVGAGIDTDAGVALTVGSGNATSITLQQNTTISGSKTFTTGTGVVTVNGVATFTAAGTALVVNNDATVTGTTTATGGVLTSSVDTATGTTLTIGGTNATATNIGGNGTITLESDVTFAAGDQVTAAVGNGAFDFSNATGGFATPTGTLELHGNIHTNNYKTLSSFDFSGATSATFLTSGGANTLSGNTTVAANKSFSAAAGSGNFDFSSSTGTFDTSSGTNTLHGNVSVSSGKSLSSAGGAANFDWSSSSGTFQTSTGTNTLHGNVSVSSGKSLSSAGGAANFDWSSSSGTFLTSSGINTLSGATTIPAANGGAHNVALYVANNVRIDGDTVVNGSLYTTSVDVPSPSGELDLGTAFATSIHIGSVGVLTEVLGDFKVDGAETIVGTSTFQNNLTVLGSLQVTDGYSPPLINATNGYVALNSDTTSTTPDGTGVLLQNDGYTGLEVDYGGSTGAVNLWVPSGAILQATGTGQIIATSSTGTADVTISVTASGFTVGQLGYISAAGAVTKAKADALSTSYVVTVAPASNPTTTGYVAGSVKMALDANTYNPGDRLYLSDATAGQVTNVAPSTTGHVVAPVGLYFDSTFTASGGETKNAIIQILTPTVN